LAALAVLLKRYSRQQDVVIGSSMLNRAPAGFENSLGNFSNFGPLRIDLSGEPDFRQLVERVHRMIGEVAQHLELPFEKLLEALRPARDQSYHPFFQVVFEWEAASQPGRSRDHGNLEGCCTIAG